MDVERRIVNDHVFLLGLDNLYREAIKQHERGQLLGCARKVAAKLNVSPGDEAVEGYYTEDKQLSLYFQLLRALQKVAESRIVEVAAMAEFERLLEVASSPIYGQPKRHKKLLPVGRDPFSEALIKTQPEWNIQNLTDVACKIASETDDISLVGLAALMKNAFVLTALRESVVLYAESICCIEELPAFEYIWQVDIELAKQASRFVDTFNQLFNEDLPSPEPHQAEKYWLANQDNDVLGRCVRLGQDENQEITRYYHWAICMDGNTSMVQEFWHDEIWTTSRYRDVSRGGMECAKIIDR